MEIKKIFVFPTLAVNSLLEEIIKSYNKIDGITFFNDIMPTAAIFKPTEDFKGSLHFLLMLPGHSQDFHFHPTCRYVLIIGDTELTMQFNDCGVNDDPNNNFQTFKFEKNTLFAVRFKANIWHKFLINNSDSIGCATFTFHEIDQCTDSSADLMNNETTFWKK